ncbi:replication protein A 32 kDa subunit B-like [Lolium perenne]|uniref:replication protein A 32 kDa subunit B-like n=1 Tax=Lolium perenne TaxID=4522 RepID=UPI0021F68C17|nr:replication protein A 32 kDa subunit B-like [Lolium perenne]
MDQINQAKNEQSLAIVPVAAPACFAEETPVAKSRQTSVARFFRTKEKTEVYKGKTLMPVNTKQIADAWNSRTNEFMVINNTAVSSIKVIGQIRGKKTDEYKGTFWIEDCCGAVKASIWFTHGRDELEFVSEGSYAAVIGSVKLAGVSPEIQCYDCRPVTNFNDIPHHHLSVIATHIDLVMKPEKGVYARVAEMWAKDVNSTQNAGDKLAAAAVKMEELANKTCTVSPKKEILSQDQTVLNIAEAPLTGSPTCSQNEATMKMLRLQFGKGGPEGVHVDYLSEQLNIDNGTTRKVLEALAIDGEVYTTVDTDHFAPT